jgi:ubiquinone/menaquinone biosynthesis C-methylase UbiE
MIRLLHWIAAIPFVYNLIQHMAGIKRLEQQIRQLIADVPQAGLIVDVGGGTGIWRTLWTHPQARYVCVDLDPQKLEGYVLAHQDPALLADASRLPFADNSIDKLMYIFIWHHLDEETFIRALLEAKRTLKSGGHLIVMEPVWDPFRWAGRMLWALDRGSYPRTHNALLQIVGEHFTPFHTQSYAIYHRYLLGVFVK